MIKVRYSYWTGDETELIDFETNAKPKTIKKLMRDYDREYGNDEFDGALEEYIRFKGYKFKPLTEDIDVYYEA